MQFSLRMFLIVSVSVSVLAGTFGPQAVTSVREWLRPPQLILIPTPVGTPVTAKPVIPVFHAKQHREFVEALLEVEYEAKQGPVENGIMSLPNEEEWLRITGAVRPPT